MRIADVTLLHIACRPKSQSMHCLQLLARLRLHLLLHHVQGSLQQSAGSLSCHQMLACT